jgi:hypothetical protein
MPGLGLIGMYGCHPNNFYQEENLTTPRRPLSVVLIRANRRAASPYFWPSLQGITYA